ncbi:MAG: hypothetical protein OEZ34_04130 [Spirochaetia bacterium]|nr:hypothetical protein [Spirochaetia bacterium]
MVYIALTDSNKNMIHVQEHPAKSGFTVFWFQGLKLILHKHPGTGMVYNLAYEVEIKKGKVNLKFIENKNDLRYYKEHLNLTN